jgi:hypothetical protein
LCIAEVGFKEERTIKNILGVKSPELDDGLYRIRKGVITRMLMASEYLAWLFRLVIALPVMKTVIGKIQ